LKLGETKPVGRVNYIVYLEEVVIMQCLLYIGRKKVESLPVKVSICLNTFFSLNTQAPYSQSGCITAGRHSIIPKAIAY